MADLDDLANDMDALVKRLGVFSDQIVKDAAMTILIDLVQSTPADVGSAITNWQLTLDAPAERELAAYVPSLRGRTVKGLWEHRIDPAITAQANIPPTVDAAKGILVNREPGQFVFITNNLPYIRKLNDGSSDQAPAGFVDRAIILGNQVIAKAQL